MRRLNDLTGKRFGRLMVLGRERKQSGARKFAWRCQCECGKITMVDGFKLNAGHTKSCGCLRAQRRHEYKGEIHHAWNGGQTKSRHGYVMLRIPDHPAQQNCYVQEHRVVMEKMIGRYLEKNETVHHKNGIRTDNRPENLELWTKAHSYGQRVSDLVQWAEELLAKYAPQKLAMSSH